MQTVHAREPYKLERHRTSIPHVLLAQRHDLCKRRVVGAFHIPKADRGLVHEQLERLGSAFGRYGGSEDERADAHGLVELCGERAARDSRAGKGEGGMAYVDAQEQLSVCAALEVDIGRDVQFLCCEDRFEVVWYLLVETVYLRDVQVLQERDLSEKDVSEGCKTEWEKRGSNVVFGCSHGRCGV